MKTLVGSILTAAIVLVTQSLPHAVAKNIDLTGDWEFSMSDSVVSGMCPMGGDGKGLLTIKKQGNDKYTIQYVKGMACRPAKVCVLPGTCKGSECVFSTSVKVDSGGGRVTNKAKLRFNMNHAHGSGKSEYSHPNMKCSWSYLLKLTR